MPLIRLTTTDPHGIFNSHMNGGLLVQPNSQIALDSATFQVRREALTINQSNFQVGFQITNADTHIARLSFGEYNSDDFQVFFDDFEAKLNGEIGKLKGNLEIKTASEIGKQFQMSLADESIKIKCDKARASPRGADLLANAPPKTLNGVANTKCIAVTNLNANAAALSSASKTTLGADSYKATTSQTHPIAKGCGIHRVRCNTLANVGGSADGFSIGLHETNPKSYTGVRDMTINDVAHGIKAVTSYDAAGEQTGHYRYVIDGLSYPTSVLISPAKKTGSTLTKDILSLEVAAGKIRGVVYQAQDGQNPPLVNVLFTDDHDNNTDLFASYTLHGAGNTAAAGATSAYSCLIDQIRFTPDPYKQPIDPLVTSDTELLGGSGTTNQYNQPTIHQITFSGGVSNWLGYSSPRLPVVKGTFQVEFTAASIFKPELFKSSFLLQTLSFPIESFDAGAREGGRVNILSAIPFDAESEAVQYSPKSRVFLDLNNAKAMLLGELRFRLLRKDYSPCNLVGMSTLVVDVRAAKGK